MKKILVTGGKGRFSKILKESSYSNRFIFRNKSEMNIASLNSILRNIKKYKPKYVLHLAGLSRPMSQHEKNIEKSINLNIVGTCNVVMACLKLNIKLIYFSTSYIYEGKKGDYKETDPVLPWNNYGWSKLGGESAVQMYKNSLILRVCMTEKPFIHKSAYSNVKTNFIYQEDIVKMFIKLINKKGVVNLGGKSQTIYSFAKKNNKKLKKKYSKGEFPLNQTMNLSKLKKLIR
tara:strand:- start:136 stop:831 length:696 start_codon:yes stop_codon:yes gene_type:complete